MWSAQSSGGFLFCCVNISVSGLSLKQIQKVSVALGIHPRVRHEAEGGAVDAVAHTVGRLRIAGKHMTQMGVPARLRTSVRRMPWLKSSRSTTAGLSMGFVKAGQPQPLSNLSVEENSGSPVTMST